MLTGFNFSKFRKLAESTLLSVTFDLIHCRGYNCRDLLSNAFICCVVKERGDKMEAYYSCMRFMNQKVRITTRDGCVHVGRIVKVDCDNVYLETDRRNGTVTTSAFFPFGFGARSSILTLSLFTLLAIALI